MLSNMWFKRKNLLEALLVPAIILLVAVGAFGLGRLSVLQTQQDKLIIHYPGEALQSDSGQASTTAQSPIQ